MKIALTADWLTTLGGAERVIAAFHQLWPEAPLFTTVANREALGELGNADIRTTHLQWIYRLIGRHRILFPWMPRAMESIDLTGYEVVLSSSHAVGKGIIPPTDAVQICYCHTPVRYAWEMEQEYLQDSRIPRFFHKRIRQQLQQIRRWDMTTADRVDHFLANSTETQQRIQRIYNRESTVISPPVSDHFFGHPLPAQKEEYYLALGRFVPYKRFDLLIDTANALRIPLKIAGTGPEENRLQAMAGPTVEFLGRVPEADLPALYASAKAFLFSAYEDAGIVPLEAQACGTPVIAYGKGGVLDTVKDGETGLYFAEQTEESLSEAIGKLEKTSFNSENIRAHAERFSAEKFCANIANYVKNAIDI